ncbi:MAG: DUF4956 domain-containing protein [Coriobacteriales bacterium]|jgi:uncharacterized membrane protein YhiD involved in acid resistance
MSDYIFTSILGDTSSVAATVSSTGFMICSLTSIILGAAVAAIYMFKHTYSKNFVITLALLPLIVQMVILLVNGNLGAGIAVMGVFNLVRFRSVPGSAKDICSVFFAMAIGLATGMGFVVLAIIFTIIVGIVNIIYVISPFGKQKQPAKVLKITVPEDMDYEGVFEDVLSNYTDEFSLESVQTTNMGSLFQLEYSIHMKGEGHEKQMIDEIRCLNGNLKISCGRAPANRDVL